MVIPMNVQRKRLLLRAAAMILLVLSGAVLVWAFQGPAAVIDQADDLALKGSAVRTAKLVGSPPLEEFAKVWRKPLRRPLYDPPPAPKEPKRKEKKDPTKQRRKANNRAAAGVQLVGTMVEDGRSLAVFMNSSGKIDLKGVGESLELAPGMRVDRVDLTQVVVTNQGQQTTLQIPNTKAP